MKTLLARVIVLGAFAITSLPLAARAQTPVLYGAVPGANSPLYIIDPNTGAFTAVGNIGFGITGLAFHPITGVLYGTQAGEPNGISARNLIRIDTTTGAGTIIGPIGQAIADIAFRSDGTLFGWTEDSDDLVTINLTTGAPTVVGNAGVSTRGSGLAFHSDGTLYLAGNNGNGALRTVDTTTGLTTIAVTMTGAPQPGSPIPAMKFHPITGELWAVNRGTSSPFTAHLIKIDKTTGATTTIGTTVPRIDALAWSPVPRAKKNDFDGDRNADLVVRNPSTSVLSLLLFANPGAPTTAQVTNGLPLTYEVAGVGDADGDRHADLFLRERQNGDVAVWLMDGAGVKSTAVVGSGVPLEWQIAGIADLNGDLKDDIVWRHPQLGHVVVWFMDGTTVRQGPQIALNVPLSWQLAGIGDLNGDGKADLVWRHAQFGQVAVWLMDGARVSGVQVSGVLGVPVQGVDVPPNSQLAGVGDLDRDGKSDLVWYNPVTGNVATWLMDGGTVKQAAYVAFNVPLDWQLSQVLDVNGDNNADLVWHRRSNGQVATWLMNGATVTAGPVVAQLALGVEIQPLSNPGSFGSTIPPPSTIGPGPGIVNIDSPGPEAFTGQSISVSGWAIDRQATSNSGVDQVHVYLFPIGSGTPLVGKVAAYGAARPDVANVYGSQFLNSGFASTLLNVPNGNYQLSVFGRRISSGSFDIISTRTITVTGYVAPTLVIDAPSAGAAVSQPFTVRGWAVDGAAGTGTGVNAVHVYAFPSGSSTPVLGVVATYGTSRPDIGNLFGSRFTDSGYTATLSGLPPGSYTITAFGRTTATGTFNLVTSRTIVVQ